MTQENTSYRGVGSDYVLELGKVAMAGAFLEDAVYQIGEALGMDSTKLRGQQGAAATIEVRARIVENGVPPWAAPTSDGISTWCSGAKGALKERGKLIHSTAFQRLEDGELITWSKQTGREAPEQKVDVEHVRKFRRRLDTLVAEGQNLYLSLLPMVAPKVYMVTWGSRGGAFVANEEDGQYPQIPEDRSGIPAVIDRMWDWCESLTGGIQTEVMYAESPHGLRIVPPWFGDLKAPSS